MRSPIVLALLVCLLGSSNSFAQDSDSQRQLAEIQKRIDRLNAELEAIKTLQGESLPEPILVDPVLEEVDPVLQESRLDRSVLESYPEAFSTNQSPQPLGYSSPIPTPYPEYQSTYPQAPVQPYPSTTYGGLNYGYPPTVIQTPAIYDHTLPVYRQPVYVDPGFGPGFGGPSVYVGPGGWGLNLGGVQMDFRHGNHGFGSGRGRGNGHKHGRGNKR